MDRNVFGFGAKLVHSLSLSARRAWIEIITGLTRGFAPRVALRKESVDRNVGKKKTQDKEAQSLSARRAWIEISIS